jgi:hypothetical protein
MLKEASARAPSNTSTTTVLRGISTSSTSEVEGQSGQSEALPTIGMIMPISGCLATEFESKKHRSNYFREVQNICVEGKVVKT